MRGRTAAVKSVRGLAATVANPFKIAGMRAKIPDGKTYLSNAIRLNRVHSFTVLPTPANTLAANIAAVTNQLPTAGIDESFERPRVARTGEVHEFLFFPGLNNGLLQVNALRTNTTTDENDAAQNPQRGLRAACFPYVNHSRVSANVADDTTPVYSLGVQYNQQEDAQKVNQWRIVSQGLKISLINNATSNQGWYEAVRITLPKESDQWNFNFPLDTRGPGDNQKLYPGRPTGGCIGGSVFQAQPTAAGGLLATGIAQLPHSPASLSDISVHPSYVTGKLRDIHKHIFTLRPNTDDHEFQSIADGDIRSNPSAFVDSSFDAIYIRLHVTDESQFMLHWVSNQEVVYDENSTMARTATRTSPAVSPALVARTYASLTPITPTKRANAAAVVSATYSRKYRRKYLISPGRRLWK
jgi:hypothetical protein